MIEKVTVAGHIAIDHIFDIPYYPEKNHSIFIKSKEEYFGGGAANIAAGIAKLGCKSELVAAVDKNFEKSAYHNHLKRMGVELNVKKFDGEIAQAYIFNDDAHNQITYFYWGVSENMRDAKIEEREVIHIAPSHPEFAYNMAGKAKFLAFEPGQDIPRYDKEKLSSIIEKTDILFCNIFELKKIERIVGMKREKLKKHMDLVVTEGEKGSVLHAGGKTKKIPSVEADVIDPTGAGDAYRAAFWAGLMHGMDMEESCKLGSIASSLVVGKKGAQTGLPDWGMLIKKYEILSKAEKI
ncbi:MAG TPA: carbohydrate kinase family protein [Thermoplasmatales archaeon]|nr:carbohydrate kinase family protein [Thermoplasmata archaeon]HHH83957.1 carbohydrate kinase family protein [Thermoplasmatales archaeon]